MMGEGVIEKDQTVAATNMAPIFIKWARPGCNGVITLCSHQCGPTGPTSYNSNRSNGPIQGIHISR